MNRFCNHFCRLAFFIPNISKKETRNFEYRYKWLINYYTGVKPWGSKSMAYSYFYIPTHAGNKIHIPIIRNSGKFHPKKHFLQ